MAGHSKWANVKHRKGAQDAKRGRIWSKVCKELMVAARMGGGDVGSNSRLRDAISWGRSVNLPKDTMERAIKKGTGELGATSFEEVVYEGYGPGGAAVLVEGLTDNRTRTVGEVRFIFSKNGGNMGESGCVAWMFEKKGFIQIPLDSGSEEEIFDLAVELGADEVTPEDDSYIILCSPTSLSSIQESLERKGIKINQAEVIAEPSNTVELDKENSEKMLKLLDTLEDNDDVQKVHSNAQYFEE